MFRANWFLGAAILMMALAGCNQGAPNATAPTTESAPSETAGGAGQIDSEAKAREFATTQINEYIAGQTFTNAEGSPPKVETDTWSEAVQEGDRWTLKRGPPGNWYYRASFNVDGSNPEYEVVYFAE